MKTFPHIEAARRRAELAEEIFFEQLEESLRPAAERRAQLLDLARRVRALNTDTARAAAEKLERRAEALQ